MNLLRIFLYEFLTGLLKPFVQIILLIMKVKNFSNIPIEFLIGSCITLSSEDEGRVVKQVCMDLDRHSIILIDDEGNGMYWESLQHAEIQFQGGR